MIYYIIIDTIQSNRSGAIDYFNYQPLILYELFAYANFILNILHDISHSANFLGGRIAKNLNES